MAVNGSDTSLNVLLEDDKDETPKENEQEDKDDVLEEDEDEEEGETEDEEDAEEKDEDEEEVALTRVEFSDVKGKFPNLFKEFPTLKHAFFREQQFTEIFPTVEEAKKALEVQNAYEEITAAVVDGDVKKFITELKNESEEGVTKFAENFLPSLQEENRDLYLSIVTPVLQGFIKNVFNHGASESNDNIKNAAKIVHKVLFGGTYDDVEKDIVLTRPKKEDDKVTKDRQEYFAGKYNNLYKEVTDSCYSKLDDEIAKGLADLKARPGMQKIIAKEIKQQVLAEMEKDSNYVQRMNGLWKREQRQGFSGSMKQSLITSFLGKSKNLLPKIRIAVRKEALGKEDTGGGDKKDPTRLSGGKESKSSKKVMNPQRQKEEKLSALDIFNAD